MHDQLVKQLLRAWYDEAKGYGKLSLSFDEFFAYAKTNAGFIENFGNAAFIAQSSLGFAGLITAMENLADSTEGMVTQYPDGYFKGTEFYDALYDRVQAWDLKRIVTTGAAIASEGLEAAASAAKIGLSAYVLFSALGVGVALYLALHKGKAAA